MRAALLALAALAACDATKPAADPDFGDPYRVLEASLADGRLTAVVEYGGGCAEHEFSLGGAVGGGGASLWLTHDANGDLCEALLTETVVVPVPPRLRPDGPTVLQTPGDDGAVRL